jgi:hypothetical protein
MCPETEQYLNRGWCSPRGEYIQTSLDAGRPRIERHNKELETRGSGVMADQGDDDTNIPTMQRILDNPFILLFIGILIPTLTYIIWGVMQLVSLPIAD